MKIFRISWSALRLTYRALEFLFGLPWTISGMLITRIRAFHQESNESQELKPDSSWRNVPALVLQGFIELCWVEIPRTIRNTGVTLRLLLEAIGIASIITLIGSDGLERGILSSIWWFLASLWMNGFIWLGLEGNLLQAQLLAAMTVLLILFTWSVRVRISQPSTSASTPAVGTCVKREIDTMGSEAFEVWICLSFLLSAYLLYRIWPEMTGGFDISDFPDPFAYAAFLVTIGLFGLHLAGYPFLAMVTLWYSFHFFIFCRSYYRSFIASSFSVPIAYVAASLLIPFLWMAAVGSLSSALVPENRGVLIWFFVTFTALAPLASHTFFMASYLMSDLRTIARAIILFVALLAIDSAQRNWVPFSAIEWRSEISEQWGSGSPQ